MNDTWHRFVAEFVAVAALSGAIIGAVPKIGAILSVAWYALNIWDRLRRGPREKS